MGTFQCPKLPTASLGHVDGKQIPRPPPNETIATTMYLTVTMKISTPYATMSADRNNNIAERKLKHSQLKYCYNEHALISRQCSTNTPREYPAASLFIVL